MQDFSAILTRGDEIMNTWLADTQSDPAAEAGKVSRFATDVYNMRLALEADYNTMTGEQAETGALVKEAVRPPGAERGVSRGLFQQFADAADALAKEISSSQNYDRQNLEDRITATTQAFQGNIDSLKNRQRDWNSTVQAQIKMLSD
jgi:hypothetical protein